MKPHPLEIKSILGVTQYEDFLEFEVMQVDSEGKAYASRFRVRNHNIGLFNRVLRKIRPTSIPGKTLAAFHTTPKSPAP